MPHTMYYFLVSLVNNFSFPDENLVLYAAGQKKR